MSDPNPGKGAGFTLLNFFKSKNDSQPSSLNSSQPRKTESLKRKGPVLSADIFNDENQSPSLTHSLAAKKIKLTHDESFSVNFNLKVGDACILNGDVNESGSVKSDATCHLVLSINQAEKTCRLGNLLRKTQTTKSLSSVALTLDIDQLIELDHDNNKSFELAICLLKRSVHGRINFEFSDEDSIEAIINNIDQQQDIFSDNENFSDDVIRKKKKPKKAFKIKNFFFDAEKFTQPVEIQFNTNSSVFSEKNQLQLVTNPEEVNGKSLFSHHNYDFLKEQNIKDKHGLPFSDSSADRSTLFVPQSFLNSKDITPAMRQWWKFKSEHYDTVLFFKLGKFYETYHMDADIAVKECGLVYMRGGHAHAGFPETSFAHYCSMLVDRGYKVARVEQTETPAMMNERVKSQKTGAKVVARELVSITTPGCRIYDPFDIDSSKLSGQRKNGLLAAVYFGTVEEMSVNLARCKIGICILNSATGSYYLSEFVDDINHLVNLKTLVSTFCEPILELLVSKQLAVSQPYIYSHVKQVFPSARIELVTKHSDKFYKSSQSFSNYIDSDSVIAFLKDHFKNENCLDVNKLDSAICLAYVVNYLAKNMVDHKINFYKKISYIHPSTLETKFTSNEDNLQPTYLVLDFAALSTLDIIEDNTDSLNDKTTILSMLDHCGSAFGSRRMLHLLSRPLFDRNKLQTRQHQIDQLIKIDLNSIHDQFKTLPDLEKLLFRVHSFSVYQIEQYKKHPEYRAVMFNQEKFSKKKINDLSNCVKGFQKVIQIVDAVLENEKLTSFHGDFFGFENSDLCAAIDTFTDTFDLDNSTKTGTIVLKKNTNSTDIDKEIARIEEYFEEKLLKIVKKFKLKRDTTKYWSSGKLQYLIEVSTEDSKKLPQQKFVFKSNRKGFVRYIYSSFDGKIDNLKQLNDKKNKMMADSLYWVMGEFSKNHTLLQNVTDKMALLDCLICLAKFSLNSYHTGKMCRPEFVFNGKQQFVDIVGGYHPILACKGGGDIDKTVVVANDTQLGGENCPNLMLVTGPNMGGKSTLLRQVAVITILAQMGCYVPAERCALTPVDRIFVRLGAAFDRPNQNQSTFYVEMCETSYILKYASSKSLVLIDELGRGTATHDGTAIAGAVLDALVDGGRPLAMFSTHYHSLVQKYVIGSSLSGVKFGYMGYMEGSTKDGDITFLYKLIEGVCDKSFGFSVAKMAGVDDAVIERARATAELFSCRGLLMSLLRVLLVGEHAAADALLAELAV